MSLSNDTYFGKIIDKRLSCPLATFSCYRYSPEQFKAYRLAKTKNGIEYVPIKGTDRIGYILISEGENKAIAELKKLIRKEDHKPKILQTYGFLMEGSERRYSYFQDMNFKPDAPIQRRYEEYKRIIAQFDYQGWDVCRTTEAKLGAGFVTESVREIREKIDRTKPVVINLRIA